MKDIDTVVEDLFYLIIKGICYDVGYRERQVDLEKKLGRLASAKGVNSTFELYMKDVLKNIEDIEDSFIAREVKQDKLLIEIENAVDEREMQAIKIACRTGILCGINFCKNRDLGLRTEKEEQV